MVASKNVGASSAAEADSKCPSGTAGQKRTMLGTGTKGSKHLSLRSRPFENELQAVSGAVPHAFTSCSAAVGS